MDPDALRADLPPPDRGAWSEIAGSLFAHLALLTIAAFTVPSLGEITLDEAPDQPRYLSFAFADGAAVPDEAEHIVTAPAREDPDEEEPAESRCGEAGGCSMGHPDGAFVALRYGVQGPIDNPDPHVGHSAADAQTSFAPVIFASPERSWGGDVDAPTAPWGRDDSLGNDPASARGHMWATETGRAFGAGGASPGPAALCDTCGASGRGASLRGTAPGGLTGTEISSRLIAARPR